MFFLTFAIAFGIYTLVFGQTVPKAHDINGLRYNNDDFFRSGVQSKKKNMLNHQFGQNDRSITKVGFTGSRNMFSSLVTESNCLTANQDLNVILFTHRISHYFNPPGANSGFIQTTFTNNFGQSWDSIIVMSDSVNLGRYPSAAIYNPVGNTNISNAFVTASGPCTNLTSSWTGNYFASAKLDSSNVAAIIATNNTQGVVNQHFARISSTATDLKTIVTGSLLTNPLSTTSVGYRGATLNYAKPNTNGSFNWLIDSIKPAFYVNSSGISEVMNNLALTAWNKVGDIGYVVFLGVDSSAIGLPLGYAPIVYKTIDTGNTWVKLPAYNFSAIPSIAAYLKPTIEGDAPRASYSKNKGIDVAVDANGQLHIFSTIVSTYSSVIDDIANTYSYAANAPKKTFYMYDTYTVNNVFWDAVLVDSLHTDNALDFSPFTDDAGQFEIDARMQLSRTDDGTKLFYFWLESNAYISQQLENYMPNIFGKAYDVSNNVWTVSKKFTNDDENYFMYVSDITLSSGGTFKVPVTISMPLDWPFGAYMLNPVRHILVNGIEFNQGDFTVTKVNELNITNNTSEISVFPNPCSSNTGINLLIDTPKKVIVDLYDMKGLRIKTYAYEFKSVGEQKIQLDLQDVVAGAYYCTITSDGNRYNKKILVVK